MSVVLKPVGPDEFRTALARFSAGVTVVTAAHEGREHGLTASSFCSVSLDPPLILVCLGRASTTFGLIEASGRFAVNILPEDSEAISRHYADPSREGMLGAEEGACPPRIRGAIAVLVCRLHEVHDCGDHRIVVGEVVETSVAEGPPLLYHLGAYRRLAVGSA